MTDEESSARDGAFWKRLPVIAQAGAVTLTALGGLLVGIAAFTDDRGEQKETPPHRQLEAAAAPSAEPAAAMEMPPAPTADAGPGQGAEPRVETVPDQLVSQRPEAVPAPETRRTITVSPAPTPFYRQRAVARNSRMSVLLRPEPNSEELIRRIGSSEVLFVGEAVNGWRPARTASGERGWILAENVRTVAD